MAVVPFYVGDELELRKPHACGANHWLVHRVGADLRLECARCGRRLLLPRSQVEQQVRRFLARGPAASKSPREGGKERG
ncbi:MAG: DUF951 domain-containing protein [Phycisphaerales bacterium]|nr:DUF951 domain-containing protein [Phycisphaerales bacterium]